MMNKPINTDMFFYDKEERDFCQEASTLQIPCGIFPNGLILVSQWTGQPMMFTFKERIMSDSGEEVGGWVYVNNPAKLTCTIWND